MRPEKLEDFVAAFENKVREVLPGGLPEPEIFIDDELDLIDITPKFFRLLKRFAPFGPGNMKPVFMTRDLRDTGFARRVGRDQKHLKMNLIDGTTRAVYPAIAFGLGDLLPKVKTAGSFAAAYHIEENVWNNTVRLQLNVKDIRFDL